jgi:hypothetical protein
MDEQPQDKQRVAPGSRQEAEALARIDAAREADRATYEPQRRGGWSARAGSPRHGLSLSLDEAGRL